jgi:hypothetical protein
MALVAVSVYVPAEFTVAGFAAFNKAPPFHVSILPALVPVKVDVNAVHVILPELVADVIIGNVVFVVTDTTVVDAQPVTAFVAVKV